MLFCDMTHNKNISPFFLSFFLVNVIVNFVLYCLEDLTLKDQVQHFQLYEWKDAVAVIKKVKYHEIFTVALNINYCMV